MEGQNNGPFYAASMSGGNQLRLCMVKQYKCSYEKGGIKEAKQAEKKAIFHRWTEERQLVDASPMIGGHPGGEIAMTLAIVEYMNGRVDKVPPTRIRFLDTRDNLPIMAKHNK